MRSILALVALAGVASAAPTIKLVVSLEVPPDSVPQHLCVVTGGGGCDPKTCRTLASLDDYLHDDGGTLIPRRPAVTLAVRAALSVLLLQRVPQLELPAALDDALGALWRTESCNQASCRPTIRIHQSATPGSSAPVGNIACTRNLRATGHQRVAVVSLDYHQMRPDLGVSSLELLGTELTVQQAQSSDPRDFAFLVGIGGNYASDTTSIATRERAQLALLPRCTTFPIELPPRRSVGDETLSATLNGLDIDTCRASGSTAPSVEIPTQPSGSESTLGVAIRAQDGSAEERYEASWTDPLPPRPLRLRHRVVEFEWTRHCLAGSIPLPPKQRDVLAASLEGRWSDLRDAADPPWTELCPRAELTAAGATCTVKVSDASRCRYRCEAPAPMPAFALPTSVRFTREGDQVITSSKGERSNRHVTTLAWQDALTYAGQPLDSFVPAAERGVVVVYRDPSAWLWTARRPLDVLEISRPGQAGYTVSLKYSERPNWELVATPNATCGDVFDGNVRGWRLYDTRTLVRDDDGNVDLRDPDDFAPILHDLSLVFGVGFAFAQMDKGGGQPLVQPIGLSLTTRNHAWSGAWELGGQYELTKVDYNGLHPRGTEERDRLRSVYYQRLMLELSYLLLPCWHAPCSRRIFFGFTLGVGAGGPILPETDKVGVTSAYGLANVFVRWRVGERWAADFGSTTRVGEMHRRFGYEVPPYQSADQTFVGDPIVDDRPVVQLGFYLRVRRSFR